MSMGQGGQPQDTMSQDTKQNVVDVDGQMSSKHKTSQTPLVTPTASTTCQCLINLCPGWLWCRWNDVDSNVVVENNTGGSRCRCRRPGLRRQWRRQGRAQGI